MGKLGVSFDPKPPEVHAARVERMIRVIKERVRSVVNGLGGKGLPDNLLFPLIQDIVQSINLTPNSRTGVDSPRYLVTGKKLDFKYDMKGSFGEVAMFRVPIENRRQGDVAPRAIHGIIVGRVLGQKGAVRVYFPDTGTIATRAHWIKSPLNQNMFNLTGTGGILAGVDPKNKLIADDSQVTDDSDVPELIYDDTGESTESTESSMTLSHLVNLVKDVAMKRPKHVLSEQDPVKKKAGIQAMVNECKSMIKYGVFAPHDHRVRTETRPLRSNTFIKEKYKANGDWDKTKCRMTGSGNEQDDDTFGETSSPTADTSSSLIILNVASRYKVKVKSWDAPCAFLNSILEELVYMCIEPIMAKILIELCPELVIGLRPDGWLIVRLVKALYGLKQAGLMWYKTLRKFMESLGFYVSSKDQGVFIKRDGNDWIYVTVHVDDLLIVAKSDELST
jgi:hypothetical protein